VVFGVVQSNAKYILTSSVHYRMKQLARIVVSRRYPILLQGPTSAGKTSLVEYLAKLTGQKFVRINNHEHTDLQEYMGSYLSDSAGRLTFQEGALVEAVRNGYWIVLDELNLAPSEVLEALNRLLDDNRELYIPETQQTVRSVLVLVTLASLDCRSGSQYHRVLRPHPNFLLFATQNPPGIYGGRKVLSRAFRNRFVELHVDGQSSPALCVCVYCCADILRWHRYP
jgi:midasin